GRAAAPGPGAFTMWIASSRRSTQQRRRAETRSSWRGGTMATAHEAAMPATRVRDEGLPRREVREMPEPPRNYWRLVGPGIVAGGVGLSSGEFVLWPFIASQVGL